MKYRDYVKQEIAVIKDRDPAIKSDKEVYLYPSFKAILKYRKAHKLYLKGILQGEKDFTENCKTDWN